MCPLELEGGDLPKGAVLFVLLSIIKRRHFSPKEVKQLLECDFLQRANVREF